MTCFPSKKTYKIFAFDTWHAFPSKKHIQQTNAHIFDDLSTEDTLVPAARIGIDGGNNSKELQEIDKSKGFAVDLDIEKYKSDVVGEKSSDNKSSRKTFFKDSNGRLVPIMAKASKGKGETVYDARLGEVLFNISSSDE